MDKIVRFFKNWALAVAMLTGTLIYVIIHLSPGLNELKPRMNEWAEQLMPVCQFLMLFFTFCKVNPKDLCLRPWFIALLLFQVAGCGLLVLLICLFPQISGKLLFEGAMLLLICPTAAAAPIITGKLGGSEAAITSYVLLSNTAATICIPLSFPLVETMNGLPFVTQALSIMKHVFPVLLMPLLLAWLILWIAPGVHAWLVKWFHAAPFYIWAFNLILLTGVAWINVVNNRYGWLMIAGLAGVGLLLCIIQFVVGRKMGGRSGETVCAGQALGQKNSVFAVWVACTYLPGVTSLVPCSYILWQNMFNSWELSRKNKR